MNDFNDTTNEDILQPSTTGSDGRLPRRRPASRRGDAQRAGVDAAGIDTRFNYKDNKVTQENNNPEETEPKELQEEDETPKPVLTEFPPHETLLLRQKKCKCRYCKSCAKSLGYDLRKRLLATVDDFSSLLMLTFTVDRNGTTTGRGFDSPEQAHDYVADNKFIPRLMRYLEIEKWMWVLEFQSKNGDGWPHWHLLIDAPNSAGRLPKEKLARIWKLWRNKWGIGGVDLVKIKFNDNAHSINYITKYLIKQPERGWPEWVLQRERIRLVGASRAIGCLVATSKPRPKKAEPLADERPEKSGVAYPPTPEPCKPKKERRKRKVIDRISECGHQTVILQQLVDKSTGEAFTRYAGTFDGSVSDIEKRMQKDDSPAEVQRKKILYIDGQYDSVEITSITGNLGGLKRFLENDGLIESFEIEVETKRQGYLSQWDNYLKEQAMTPEQKAAQAEKEWHEAMGNVA